MKQILALICALLVVTPALAAGTEGTASVSLQGKSASGDESTFKEQNEGEDSGLALEILELRGTGESPWTLDARFTTGGRGWLDLSAQSGPWSGGLQLTQVRSWSALSFVGDTLPSGTPVSSLVPPVTTLDPIFGIGEPHTDRLQAEAWLARTLGSSSSLTVRIGASERDGERVPDIGGVSFSDVGTPAFYAAGVERIDSSSTWGVIELRSVWQEIAYRFDAGLSSMDATTRYDLPAYGGLGLLDVNRWTTGTDADTKWLRTEASRAFDRLTVHGGASWSDTSVKPSGSDLRVTGSGAVLREGLALSNGDIDATTSAGAAGVTWRILPRLALTLAADARALSADGTGAIALRTNPAVAAATEHSTDRIGGTADLVGTWGSSRLRLRGRISTTEMEWSESVAPYLQDQTRTSDRAEMRVELSHRFTRVVRGRAWGRWVDESSSVDLRALDWGYALLDRDREDLTGGVELTLGRGSRRTNLSLTAGQSDLVMAPPWFDPVYDPSLAYTDVEGSVSTIRLAVTGLWSFDRGVFWGETGWLGTEYEFDQSYAQPGFALVDESLDGLVASIGCEVRPREGTRVAGQVEWVRDREDVDRTLARGYLEAGQTIRSRFEIYGRWTYGDLDAPRSLATEYTTNLFALGIRANF